MISFVYIHVEKKIIQKSFVKIKCLLSYFIIFFCKKSRNSIFGSEHENLIKDQRFCFNKSSLSLVWGSYQDPLFRRLFEPAVIPSRYCSFWCFSIGSWYPASILWMLLTLTDGSPAFLTMTQSKIIGSQSVLS